MEDMHCNWPKLIGFSNHLATFSNLWQQGKLPQVILLVGRAGLGKSHLASQLAAIPFCESHTACGSCANCKFIAFHRHRDVLHIDLNDQSIKIAQAQSVQNHLESFASSPNGSRIAVLVDVDRLTEQALNRLLKTFEEPASHNLIIMTTSRLKVISSTLLSRTIKWHVSPPTIEELMVWIKSLNFKQLESYGKNELSALIMSCGQAPGKIIDLLNNKVETFNKVDLALSNLLLGPKTHDIIDLAEKLARECKLTTSELANHSEQVLNRFYWQKLLGASSLHVTPAACRRRRQVLSQIKRVAGHQQIVLNSQLASEAIGLCGIT